MNNHYNKKNKNYANQQYQNSSYNNKYSNNPNSNKTGDVFTVINNEYNAYENVNQTDYNNNYDYNNKYSNTNYKDNAYTKDYYGGDYAPKPKHPKKKNQIKEYSIDMIEIKKYLAKYQDFTEKHISIVLDLCENKSDCLICNEPITPKSQIWNCDCCFKLIHLKCILEWINKLNLTENAKSDYKWTCPGCNTNYIQKELPVYNCYCEKYNKICKENNFDPSKILIPHSCGLICDKKICKHLNCVLPCHPGNHLTCSEIEKIYCFCGKTFKDIPCVNPNKRLLCNNTCGKKVYCNKHFCKVKCHEDDCSNYLKNKK